MLLGTSFLCVLSIATAALPFEKEFNEFTVRFNKKYPTLEEHDFRYTVFVEHFVRIKTHNIAAAKGKFKYTLGVSKFSDWTFQEMSVMNGYIPHDREVQEHDILQLNLADPVPDFVNWTSKGWVTPVQEQGECGSCWAFSAIGAIEGANYRKAGKLINLSEQELIDCDDYDHGCNGGDPGRAFKDLIQKYGGNVDTDESYPYVLNQDEDSKFECKFNTSDVGGDIQSYKMLPSGDEEALKVAVAKYGPISVLIHADDHLHPISEGVIDDPECTPDLIMNHAVLVVGYGTTEVTKEDYWIVKNSWGTGTGYQGSGYVLMSRNKGNQCGIANEAVIAFA